VILDTNAVSAILAADPDIAAVLGNAASHHLSVVVIAEYQFGMLSSRYRQVLEIGFHQLVSHSTILPCDRDTATWYATIRHELKLIGRPIPEGDLWIAALARQHSLEIVSQDTHFDQVDQVVRIGW